MFAAIVLAAMIVIRIFAKAHGPFSSEFRTWVAPIGLIVLSALEIFVVHEIWIAYCTKQWRWTLFYPMIFLSYFNKQNDRYWYRASLVSGAVIFLVGSLLISALCYSMWIGYR